MIQHQRNIEGIVKNKPKRTKAYGVKTPDAPNIVATLAGLVVILVIVAQLMM
ncbi:MAG: hypothetical protein LUQ47_05880 [Methanotrichaceae archaeon]|nr:hypothetical protein [Methanotrichaceae archaeon]